MYEFTCGSPVCKTHFTAPTEDQLMGEVAHHVLVKHKIAAPTKSLVAFLKDNTIREIPPTATTGANP
jgi:predicted small metal-binding protein